jgi:hypothetical protein
MPGLDVSKIGWVWFEGADHVEEDELCASCSSVKHFLGYETAPDKMLINNRIHATFQSGNPHPILIITTYLLRFGVLEGSAEQASSSLARLLEVK